MCWQRMSKNNRNQEFYEMDRKYSVPSSCGWKSNSSTATVTPTGFTTASDDINAWQNIGSDFIDTVMDKPERKSLPYNNSHLRDSSAPQSVLNDPQYDQKSYLSSNVYNYLKFGLPRVLPPNSSDKVSMSSANRFGKKDRLHNFSAHKKDSRLSKECSSGYDSSENETPYIHSKRRLKNFDKKYGSNPDFQMKFLTSHSDQLRNNYRSEANHNLSKFKSNSEANLLMTESQPVYDPHKQQSMTKAFRSNRSYLSNSVEADPNKMVNFIYPHLQVRNLEILNEMRNVTFEIHGGEIMAVISTDDNSIKSLFEILSGNAKKHRNGDIFLNGHNITMNLKMLHSKVAFVRNNINFCPEMNVEQTLIFYYRLKKPTAKLKHLRIDMMDRINALLEDLGLDQIKSTVVKNLTVSEKRRLNVACHLLLDTDIVILDKPTDNMDIFDTFFLIEYLRQWANGGSGHLIGRAIILSLQPPTYEIFSMLSKILLLSNEKLIYFGKQQFMTSYFAEIGFRCPKFKNPADYYLDLITLDDLSADAYAESSNRIEHLAENFIRMQPHLEYSHPGPFPLSISNPGYFRQFYTLLIKEMIYRQPISFMKWTTDWLMFLMISILIGIIFWDIPNRDPQLALNDRIGFHFTMIYLLIWPLVFYKSQKFTKHLLYVKKDLQDSLYGTKMFVFTKVHLQQFPFIEKILTLIMQLLQIILQIIPSMIMWINYLLPAYLMSGLYIQKADNYYYGISTYLGSMLLYCLTLEIFALILTSCFGYCLFTLAGLLIFFNSNITIHVNDMPPILKWIKTYFNVDKIIAAILNHELSPVAIASSSSTTLCKNKQVQRHDIIVQLPCPPPNGTHVLSDYALPIYKNYIDSLFNMDVFVTNIIYMFAVVFLVFNSLTIFLNFSKNSNKVI